MGLDALQGVSFQGIEDMIVFRRNSPGFQDGAPNEIRAISRFVQRHSDIFIKRE
jgi:hypothetical protein